MSHQIRLAYHQDYHQDGLQLHHLLMVQKKWEREIHRVSDCIRDLHHPSLNWFFQWVIAKMMMISHHQERDKRERSRSREREHPHVQVPQEPQIQPMVLLEPDDDRSDEDFTMINSSSSSAGQPSSAEQSGRTRRDERSRSRERVPPQSPRMPACSNNLFYLLKEFSRPRKLGAKMIFGNKGSVTMCERPFKVTSTLRRLMQKGSTNTKGEENCCRKTANYTAKG